MDLRNFLLVCIVYCEVHFLGSIAKLVVYHIVLFCACSVVFF